MLKQNDFEALQKQLLDLKGSNYIFEEKCKKLSLENSSLKHQNENFDGEIQKLNKIIARTKAAKEMQTLMQENELLQLKLHSQEEEFKLQHKTLMDEVSHLMKENEKLSVASDITLQLKAENNALKNALNKSGPCTMEAYEQSDLITKLQTFEEEKLLQTKIIKDYRMQIDDLNQIIDNMNDSLHKSQETIELLQEDKNNILQSSQLQLNLVRESLNSDIQSLKDIIVKMESESTTLADKCIKHEEHISLLENKVDSLSAENNQNLRNADIRIQHLSKENTSLRQDLDESKNAYLNLLQEMQKFEEKDEEKSKKFEEINKIAERRKQLLDDLSIKVQNENETHSSEVRVLKQQNEELSKKYMKTVQELNMWRERHETQEKSIQQLEQIKSQNNKQLKEFENTLKQCRDEFEVNLSEKICLYENKINKIEFEFTQNKEILEKCHLEEIASLNTQFNTLKEEYNHLKQEYNDEIEAKKLVEKKHQSSIKDIKRQLLLEKKRADKLQERLVESKLSYDDLSYDAQSKKSINNGGSSLLNGDTNSISSLDHTIKQQQSQTNDESKQLLDKIAQLQEYSWKLEEKVNHLERANAAMAQDIMNKSSIITYYSLDKRQMNKISSGYTPSSTSSSLSLTFKNLVNEIKNNNKLLQTNDIDAVKKLQLLLEETLTKNMHLEQDMEKLTKEMQNLKSR